MYLKNQYCLRNSWPSHEVIIVAFHDNYGEDSFNEGLSPEVSKSPKVLLTARIYHAIIKETNEKHTHEKTRK